MSTKDNGNPYSIGSHHWTGLSKLIEESGEVVQVCGKILGTGGRLNHWDGTNLQERLEEELAVLQAAIRFVIVQNGLSPRTITTRTEAKVKQFETWQREGK